MLIGYARVSTHEQNLDLQIDALTAAGCEKIFTDKISTLKEERQGLQEALDFLRPGDVLVVWKLDRLGRTLKQLIELIATFEQKGIGFKCLKEIIDTTSSTGKLVFHIFASLAEFERDIIHERTRAGLAAARARGRLGGRPKLQTKDPKKIALARKLYAERNMPVQEICDTLHIGRSTLYRYIQDELARAKQEVA
jgi:DNA invertase Pin-like site-specific DNA recombinase